MFQNPHTVFWQTFFLWTYRLSENLRCDTFTRRHTELWRMIMRTKSNVRRMTVEAYICINITRPCGPVSEPVGVSMILCGASPIMGNSCSMWLERVGSKSTQVFRCISGVGLRKSFAVILTPPKPHQLQISTSAKILLNEKHWKPRIWNPQ